MKIERNTPREVEELKTLLAEIDRLVDVERETKEKYFALSNRAEELGLQVSANKLAHIGRQEYHHADEFFNIGVVIRKRLVKIVPS